MSIGKDGTTRRAVLDVVKRRGPSDVAAIAGALGVTQAGVRRHVDALVADGLLATRLERRAVGRPATLYALTASGDETFPRSYAPLTSALLRAVAEELGPDGVERVFNRMAGGLGSQLGPADADASTIDRVGALARAQDAAGYLAEATALDDDTSLLVERNCAIAQVAREWPQACAAELASFQRVLGDGASIERVQHMPSGDHACTYLVRRLPPAAGS